MATPDEAGGLAVRLRALATGSGIYFVGDALARGSSILLLPLYTRALSPEDYGVLAVTSVTIVLLTLLLHLSVDSAIVRLHFEAADEDERRRLYGTVFVAALSLATAGALLLEGLGRAGALELFEDVPFSPYLELALWTAYFSTFFSIPVAIFQAQQRPRAVLSLTLSAVLLQAALTVLLVVILDQGVRGYLWAGLAAAATVGITAVFMTLRMASLRPSRAVLGAVFAFSLPIVPHNAGQWVLNAADRVVLEPYVSPAELGLYSLAYSLGAVAILFITAFTRAIQPILTAQLKEDPDSRDVPRLGTYSVVALTAACLALALIGPPALELITPPEFHDAAPLVPWVVFGYLWLAIYGVVSQGTWFSMRTIGIALGTLAAGVVNVVATILLAPSLGAKGAAIATVIGYFALALIQAGFAHRVYVIHWEYSRWLRAVVAGVATYGVATLLSLDPAVEVAWRSAVLAVVFPALLFALAFWTRDERAWLWARARSAVQRAAP